MSVIDILDNHFWFARTNTTKDLMIQAIKSMWNDILKDTNSSIKSRKRVEKIMQSTQLVVNSRPTQMIISNNIKKQSKELLKNKLVQEGLNELTSHESSTAPTADHQESPSPAKKRKYLKPKDLKVGSRSMLDLTKNGIIPKRFKPTIQDICSHFRFQIDLMLLDSEHHVIKEISKCRTMQTLYKTVDHINPFSNESELPYIKLATQKLCHLLFQDVVKREQHEVWYRSNVYGDLFDFIFSIKSGYEAKRSECHSSIVKSLKSAGLLPPDQKNVKLDFIFFHTATSIDGLICEDKPTDNESKKDRKKIKDLREKALQYWRTLLPFPECITYLIAVSCQFSKLKLNIEATKLINAVVMHSTLKTVVIPSNEHDGASWAEYLSTDISLVRLVMYNLDVIQLMTDITKEDDILFASASPILNSRFREDSPESNDSRESRDVISHSTESESNTHWEDKERKLRILEKIDIALGKFNDEKYGIFVNPIWEDIFFKEQVASDDEE